MIKKWLTWSDAWPWGLMVLIVTVLFGVFLRWAPSGNYGGTFVVGCTYLAFLGLTLRHFIDVRAEVREWNDGYKIGWGRDISVIQDGVQIENLKELVTLPINLAQFWSLFYTTELVYWEQLTYLLKGDKTPEEITEQSCRELINAAFRGCSIRVVPLPFSVDGILVGGCQSRDKITVVGPPGATEDRMRRLIQHELSHLALSALGVPREKHHAVFTAAECDF